MVDTPRYLNLGCGERFHPTWTNVDVAPCDERVMKHDVRGSLPFASGAFDAVYHSHLLEHLPRDEAPGFLIECHRVLKPGGLIRVVVPDLEQIARMYLRALEGAAAGDVAWQANYRWMVLELYDQTVRQESGGQMYRYLSDSRLPNRQFVLERMGWEGRRMMESAQREAERVARRRGGEARRGSSGRWATLGREIRQAARSPRKWLLRWLLGRSYEALQIGRFRQTGEVHQWMYDRYSLCELLLASGFVAPRPVRADESLVPDWTSYGLDIEPDLTVSKPDSLFMEALKPARSQDNTADAAGSRAA
jgi:predicted SAM-dependent methyltransferase